MCVVNITPRPLYSRERTQGLIEWGAGWASDSVCTYGRGENKSFVSVGIRTPHRPDRSLDRPQFGAVKEQITSPTWCTKFNNKFISCLYMFRALRAYRQEVKIVLYSLWYHYTYRWSSCAPTYRCDDTRDCIIQFCPPDDEHMCSKHVQAWNKLIIKFSASSWLILINKYIEMHGQQNIKKCIGRFCYHIHHVLHDIKIITSQ